MKRIAVLQFHRDWDVCRSRVALLRRMNPGLSIHGLYGGEDSEFGQAQAALGEKLDSLWRLEGRASRWKWQNTDLAVREWFADFGHELKFDVLHMVQWDLLLFAPLEFLYRHVSPSALALTGLVTVDSISDRWWWTREETPRAEWHRLQAFVRDRFGYHDVPLTCLGPGYSLPRRFLERYVTADVLELGHDELRLPLYAQLFGFEMKDTGFYPRWYDADGERFFNANGDEIAPVSVAAELDRQNGRRAFHPCRTLFRETEVAALLERLALAPAPPERESP